MPSKQVSRKRRKPSAKAQAGQQPVGQKGKALFTAAEERAFAEALTRPRKLPEIDISPAFREKFPESSEISRERHGQHEMHIYFDNGQQVGCWSLYGHGSQEGEILSDEDAASVRRWASIETKIRQLTKAQRRAFELIAINQDQGIGRKTAMALLEHGLIESFTETKRSWPTPVTIPRYSVPLPVHRIWCFMASEEMPGTRQRKGASDA